ncbi:hypothetical protein [Nocardia sp. NPDC005825]|uniref:hypothetical protein n=1 Tax=unclassified Nocardia TaxID=2637762 RepID=UPI0034119BD3
MHDQHSGHVIYKSGHAYQLRLELEWDLRCGTTATECERAGAEQAVAAIVELTRNLIEPKEFGLTKCVRFHSDGLSLIAQQPLAEGHWYLKPPGTEPFPAYTRAQMIDVETIDQSAMLAAVDTLFNAPCDLSDNQWPSWEEMYVFDTMARIPDTSVPATQDYLVVDDLDNKALNLPIPVQRRTSGVWAGKYSLGFMAPFSVHVWQDEYSGFRDSDSFSTAIELRITVHWSLWWEETSPGRALLDAAIDRLHQRGWSLV